MSEKRQLAILIPAYNERQVIARCVQSVLDAGMALEDVYVSDDGSRDGTADHARQCGVSVVTHPNMGKAGAIRTGVEHFAICERYEWVSILDADCEVAPSYFSALQDAITRHPSVALISGVEFSPRRNWLTAWRAVEHAIFGGVYREAQHLTNSIIVVPGLCSTFRCAIFKTLQDHGTMIEDMDWTIQLHRRGEQVIFEPRAHVCAQQPATIRDFLTQVQRWHVGTWQNIRLHRIGSHCQPVDVALSSMAIEAVVYAIALVMLPAIWYGWGRQYVLWGFVIDQTLLGAYTGLVAIRERRMDVIRAFPLFSLPRVLNIGSFVWAFVATRRSSMVTSGAWVSPARY